MRLATYWGDSLSAQRMAEQTAVVMGGSNLTEGTGRWYLGDKLYAERSYTVEVYVPESVASVTEHQRIAEQVLNKGTEQAVLVVVDNASALIYRGGN